MRRGIGEAGDAGGDYSRLRVLPTAEARLHGERHRRIRVAGQGTGRDRARFVPNVQARGNAGRCAERGTGVAEGGGNVTDTMRNRRSFAALWMALLFIALGAPF